MDMRAAGKGYDEFVAARHRGRRRPVPPRPRRRACTARTASIKVRRLRHARGRAGDDRRRHGRAGTAMRPQPGIEALAQKLSVSLRPARLHQRGAPQAAAGRDQHRRRVRGRRLPGPRDIPDSVAMASATASKVLGLFSSSELEREPTVRESTSRPASAASTASASAPTAPSSTWKSRDRRATSAAWSRESTPACARAAARARRPARQERRAAGFHRRADLRRDQRADGLVIA